MAWVVPGFCHPHVFVDATVQVLFNKVGLSSVKNHWVYDELYSTAMMSSGDTDGNGVISSKENAWFQKAILSPIEPQNYFNYVLRETEFLRAKEIKNFNATFQNSRLVLDFEVVFECPVTADYTMLVAVVADPSNYILITSDMENSGADAPDEIDVEYFDDALEGLTLFRAFPSSMSGLYLRFKKK